MRRIPIKTLSQLLFCLLTCICFFAAYNSDVIAQKLISLQVGSLQLETPEVTTSMAPTSETTTTTQVTYGYEDARDWVSLATALSFGFVAAFGFVHACLHENGRVQAMRISKGISLAIFVPMAIYLLGTLGMTNLGGLCGGL